MKFVSRIVLEIFNLLKVNFFQRAKPLSSNSGVNFVKNDDKLL